MQGQMNSISRVAVRLGVSPVVVFRLVKELDIEPRLLLDERPYLDDEQVDALRAHLAGDKVEALAR